MLPERTGNILEYFRRTSEVLEWKINILECFSDILKLLECFGNILDCFFNNLKINKNVLDGSGTISEYSIMFQKYVLKIHKYVSYFSKSITKCFRMF